jgi:hypothetical protein
VSLSKYYSGDMVWENLASLYMERWMECPFKGELLNAVNGDQNLAATIYGALGNSAMKWLDKSVPALDGRTPRSCLVTPDGELSLRECLIRMD